MEGGFLRVWRVRCTLFSKVIPMFRARAEEPWFAEPWHAFERDGDQLSDLEQDEALPAGPAG